MTKAEQIFLLKQREGILGALTPPGGEGRLQQVSLEMEQAGEQAEAVSHGVMRSNTGALPVSVCGFHNGHLVVQERGRLEKTCRLLFCC